jgi:hypothetical protein
MRIVRNTAARVFAYLIFVLISLVALGGVATAQGPSNGTYLKDVNDGQVPQWVTAPNPSQLYSGRCTDSNGTNWSAGQSAWISTQSGAWFTEQSVSVAAGTTSVPLNLVFANTWCFSGQFNNVIATFNLIESVTATEGATVSGIAANTIIAAGQPSNPYNSSPSWGAVAVAALPFNLNLPPNLSPGRHDIVVTLNQGKKINRAVRNKDNYNYWECVKSGGYPGGVALSDFAPCATGPAELVVTINVPQTNYTGSIQINKRDVSGGTYAASTAPGNTPVGINNGNNGNGPSWNPNGTSNPFTTSGVYVNPGNVNSNEQKSGSLGSYNSYIDIPTDYRLNRYGLSLSGEKPAIIGANDNPILTCDKPNNTGRCTVSGVRVANNDTTYVDWFLEKIPQPIEYYPWLQTKNGDVTSANNSTMNGKITGQKIGSATDPNNRRGARRAGAGTAESSFVVAASNPAGNYFCSTNYMTLGQLWANRDNLDDLSCKTGGYTPSPVNFDKVEASVSKAYADNGNGVAKSPATPNACNPKYATSAVAAGTQPSPILGLGCPNGGIQKIGVQTDTVTLSGPLTVNGRGTLWIPGKLVIINDIKYGTSTTNDPKTTPNLVIFVEGDVEIAPNVLQIDASIISMKTISTCSQSTVSTRACENKLVINGFLASDKKINFARRFYNQATPSPAELINLTSQSTTFPAPGLDRTDTDVTSKLQINSGELAPRLR